MSNNSNPGAENSAPVQKGRQKKPVTGARIVKIALLSVIILLAAVMVTACVLYTKYVSAEDGRWLIDLSSCSGVDEQDVERLQKLFPNAQVRRDVQVGAMSVSNEITSLTLTDRQGVTPEQLAEAAELLPALRSINITAMTVTVEQYELLREAYPAAEIAWTVPVCGGLSPDTESVTLSSVDQMNDLIAVRAYLPRLCRIDMTGVSLNSEQITGLSAVANALETEGVEVVWGITVAGQVYPHNTTELRLSGNYTAEDLAELKLLPCLTSLTLDNLSTGDLSPLVTITTLESLTVCNMDVDDIMVLADMDWLGAFYVKNTNVTQAQLNRLQKELPQCIIMRL